MFFVIPIDEEIDLKKAAKGSRRKIIRNAPLKRVDESNGVCERRLYCD